MNTRKHKEPVILLFAVSVILTIVFKKLWILIPGFAILSAGLISSYLASKIFYLWMLLSKILSKFTTSILLIFVFYLILTPIALIYRLVNRKKNFNKYNNSRSYFIEDHQKFTPEIFKKTW